MFEHTNMQNCYFLYGRDNTGRLMCQFNIQAVDEQSKITSILQQGQYQNHSALSGRDTLLLHISIYLRHFLLKWGFIYHVYMDATKFVFGRYASNSVDRRQLTFVLLTAGSVYVTCAGAKLPMGAFDWSSSSVGL